MSPVSGNVPYHNDSMAYDNKEGKVETYRVRTQSLKVGNLVLYSGQKRIVLDISRDGDFFFVKMVTLGGKVLFARKPPGYSWNIIGKKD